MNIFAFHFEYRLLLEVYSRHCNSEYIASNVWLMVNNELERMWKEVVLP
jgi:hypothetical protein